MQIQTIQIERFNSAAMSKTFGLAIEEMAQQKRLVKVEK